jgi:hypothetical protein
MEDLTVTDAVGALQLAAGCNCSGVALANPVSGEKQDKPPIDWLNDVT